MSDSLGSLLNGKFQQPPEIEALKSYIKNEYKTEAKVLITERQIIVSVPSAALAGTLQMQSPKLQTVAGTKKRIMIRVV